eukprot:TRINITY_DN24200_c0_g1_i1.p1 TRINITY_DN24200_c0_g1~~TRINITY_DN24200_c0_g1_i1.p1  ORF type:complete len:592 (+),score=22.66 TRINITY_DN24200_c0_g1_i1:62-1837(+)
MEVERADTVGNVQTIGHDSHEDSSESSCHSASSWVTRLATVETCLPVPLASIDDLEVYDPELLRAASLRLVLRRSRTLFSTSALGATTFEMSKPVREIDEFLSHAWRTPGWLKTVALMYYANCRRACIMSFATTVLVHGLACAGIGLPEEQLGLSYVVGDGDIIAFQFRLDFILPCLMFMIVIVFGQELPCISQGNCFVDRCCIHQADDQKKALGIQQLGGFLRNSRRLVILWQPEYFSRLWCVYEIAAFHHINSDINGIIELVPLKLPLFSLSLFVYHFCASLAVVFLAPFTVFSEWHATWMYHTLPVQVQLPYFLVAVFTMFLFGLYLLPAFFLWKFIEWHMHDRELLLKQLREFSLSKTESSSAADGAILEQKIEIWFGSVANFEHVVRTAIAGLVVRQLEDYGPIPWHLLFVGSLSHFFLGASAVIHSVRQADWETAGRILLIAVVLTFCTDCIGVGLGLRLADRRLGGERAIHKLMGPVCVASIFAFLTSLVAITVSPSFPLWLDVILVATLVLSTWLLFKPRTSKGVSGGAEPEDCSPLAHEDQWPDFLGDPVPDNVSPPQKSLRPFFAVLRTVTALITGQGCRC